MTFALAAAGLLAMAGAYKFSQSYAEDVTLGDGTRARLRLIRPSDKARLQEGFRKLSDRARYLRFFSVKERLTDEELRYLTEVDDVNHVAIGAVRLEGDEEADGLGIARCVRLPAEPEVAEPALAVTDEAQHKGLGTLLAERLSAAATERGIKRFRCEMLASNESARELLHKWVPEAIMRYDGGEALVEFDLPGTAPSEPREEGAAEGRGGPIRKVVALAANGLLIARRALDQILLARATQT